MKQNPPSGRRPRARRAVLLSLLALSAVLTCMGEARAQWTTPDASGNINSTNTGNVGVGTPNPANGKVEITSDTGVSDGEHSLLYASKSGTSSGGFRFGYRADGTNVTGGFLRSLNNLPLFIGTTGAPLALTVTNTGSFGFGTTAPWVKYVFSGNASAPPAPQDGTLFHLVNADGAKTRLNIDSFGLGAEPSVTFRYARGTAAAPSATQAGDYLGIMHGTGFGTTAFLAGAKPGVRLVATENWTDASAGSAVSFWTTASGTNVSAERMRVDHNGNVGIGTTTPSSKLHIRSGTMSGTTMLSLDTGIVGGTAMGVGGTANNESYYDMSVYRAGQYFSRFGVTNFGHVYLQPNTAAYGGVGIGTTNPAFSLDVQGAAGGADGKINASGGLCIAGDCKTAWSQVGGGGSSQWTTSGTSVYYNTGNVGVGTTSPAVKLAVGGAGVNFYNTDLWVENNLHVQGNEVMTQGGGRGRMRVGTAWGYIGLYAESASNGSANDLVLGAGSGYVRVGPNATAGAPAMNFVVPNGYVGIGTPSPLANLDVNGAHPAGIPQLQIRNGTTTARTRIWGDDSAGVEFWKNGTVTAASFVGMNKPGTALTDDLLFSTYNPTTSWIERLRVLNSNGNVGVGTASPTQKLDVAGNVNASGLCIAGDCKTAWSQVGGGTSSQWTTNGTSVYYNAGNVGVGVTNPIAKLDVRGGPDTALLVGDRGLGGSVGLQFLGSGYKHGAVRFDGDSLIVENASNTVVPSTWYNGQTMNFIVRNGNVGIGTTAPASAKLVVAGTAGAEGLDLSSSDQYANLRVIRNSNSSFDKDMFIQYQAGAGSKIHFYSNNAESMTLTSGNLGIGTATPTAKLDVAGDINVSGNINAKYQDVAEWVPSSQRLAAGTVVVLDKSASNHVLASSRAYDTKVAGVVSLRPGISLGEGGEGRLLVATTGRVKIKADASRGAIEVGDLLVTSDVEGVAMKSVPVELGGVSIHRPGTIIGKALEPLEKGTGEILVLLSLQ